MGKKKLFPEREKLKSETNRRQDGRLENILKGRALMFHFLLTALSEKGGPLLVQAAVPCLLFLILSYGIGGVNCSLSPKKF